MKNSVYLLCWLLLLIPLRLFSAEPRQSPTLKEQARTLTLLNQPVVMLQAGFGLTTPEERVQRIVKLLRTLTVTDLQQPVETQLLTRYHQQAVVFSVNKKPFMVLVQADLDEGDDLTLTQAAEVVRQRLETLRLSLKEQYSPRYILASVAKSLVGAAALILLLVLCWRLAQWLARSETTRPVNHKTLLPVSVHSFLGPLRIRIYQTLLTIICLGAGYLWLSWVLRIFPYTRVWGMDLGNYALGLLQSIGIAVLAALPGLFIVAVIFLITAFITRIIRLVLRRVEHGNLHVPGLHPATVGVTRRLISVAIWLFALSAAYPFLPGANSLAFKGISVFFGLMLTLGSAGIMNHAMSGLVLTYSRALRKGDVIRINDNEGVVTEVGMLSTKLLTRENYEVTVPNAVVVSGKITNLSSAQKGVGINLTTSVTIGYDTPWRQVHSMLELAANRTRIIDHGEPPLVRQLALMDWYIAYELQVNLPVGSSLAAARTELHSHIQDVFNEFGVQIMSPNFIAQPEGTVGVKPENWFTPPAHRPDMDVS
ncbi:mechanosensitive ion channel family protein [Pantoea phytobeneficialis]|uniref:Small-conductance mechanosensitive channel n=1 Tax=Pantoea phytobeneficialis TaxID=2052056 RepID=A0AAP9H9Z6_9GAMM|nr:mechanosensitive ion channel domain-containing protein [Pantoea phytobeneficialis]MDO6407212.1 mechanosensitive ion channel [Pantoea phytobeneficialis]QGR09182.1 mechanosensitive ion channel protein MscS [Pantoea phytobeneficialis]